ncbi:MAG: hypothetical protein NT062_08680 [Proteobacteria bacterium]|nr:hypothetical protein [Pseudomonadota bacterium]
MWSRIVLGLLLTSATLAQAEPHLPVVGEVLGETPITWPKMDWLYDQPSHDDAAGKVIVHWFCAPKLPACADDLARMLELRDHGKVYVVAHINGSKADAKRFDPIRESEGVGRGTVGYGKGVAAVMKAMSVVGPASIVVDVDGKVAMVTTGSSAAELDTRDAKVTALANAIREYVLSAEGPQIVKPGERFALAMTIKLSPWLRFAGDVHGREGQLRAARRAAVRLRDADRRRGLWPGGHALEARRGRGPHLAHALTQEL